EVALELEQLAPAGEGAGQAEAVQRRLGAGAGEADSLQTGDRFAQQAGQIGVQLVLVGAGGAARQHRLDGPPHPGVAGAQERGAVAATEVEVFTTVEVPQAAAGGAVEVHRVPDRPVEARRGADAAGQILPGLLVLLRDAAHALPPWGRRPM